MSGDAIVDALGAAGPVLLTGPVGPDGDSLGASLALARILRARGVRVGVVADAPARYDWLPDAETLLPLAAHGGPWPTVVVLDGDRDRLPPEVQPTWDGARCRGIIDHHASSTPEGYDLVWIEGTATSTCEMLHGWLASQDHPLDLPLATLLHVGSVFDTGGFRFSNTTPTTLRLAAERIALGVDHADICARVLAWRRFVGVQAMGRILSAAERHHDGRLVLATVPSALQEELGLVVDDLEGVVDILADADGAEIGALLIQRDERVVKASLRSRRDADVCALARALTPTGGGHVKAAGAVMRDTTMDEAVARVIALGAEQLV